MKYRWKGLFEKSHKQDTPDGSVNTYQQIEKQGEVTDPDSGQNVVLAVLEATMKVGNLIHFEIERTG